MSAGYMVISEREVEAMLRQEVMRHGGYAYKFVSPGTRGVPDRIVCLPDGRIFFVEMKTHGASPRPDQMVQINKLRNLGQTVRVVTGLLGLHAFFRELDWDESARRVLRRIDRGEL